MASAIAAARQQINDVGADGDLDGALAPADIQLHPDAVADLIELPDGKRIYPPRLHGAPIDELACALLDMQEPSRSRFLRLVGPPGTGKSQIARAIAHRLWTRRGRRIESRHGEPFYGYVEMSGGPSSDEFTFKYEYVPDAEHPGDVRLIPAAFVEAMQHGWVVMIDEVNTIRDVALLSLNATLDGRLSLYLPAEGRTVVARPGFAVIIAYNPGLVGASDIPDAWHSRFPATVEVTSNWPALIKLGTDARLVAAAAALDARRFDPDAGLVWTPQFRDIEALWHMIDLVGERAAVSLFISNLHEQIEAGKVQAAEGAAVARMLDEAGLARLKVSAAGRIPNLHGYPRAVTR
jgi:hypothetical protein